MKLKEIQVKNAKPRDREYKLADGQGLYLLVTSTGGKLWKWKYRVNGREKKMSLGAYPEMKLAEARTRHQEARGKWRDGVDPMAERKAEKIDTQRKQENSFESVARLWYEHWKGDKNALHAETMWTRIEGDILPEIGHLPIAQIETPAIVVIAKKIEARGAHELARRSMGVIGQIFRYAIAHGNATRNPAADVRPSDVLKSISTTNYARIEAHELPALLRKIDVYQGTHVTRIAIQLMAHTFVRTSELLGARWQEFDFKAHRWTIPAERMKGTANPTPHIVPLAPQTLALLQTLHDLTGDQEVLFPGERGNETMSNMTILKGLERMGYKGDMTGHGFRGLASTIMHESGLFESEHIDLQLAHMKRNKVSAAYNHAKYLKQRTEMMQWWADYLEGARLAKPNRPQ